jgi:hypothetical protein
MFRWENGFLKKEVREGLTYQDAIKIATLGAHDGAKVYNDSGFLVHEVGNVKVETYA